MTVNRIWGIATALVVVLVLGLGWLLGVSPLLTAAARADSERVSVDANNVSQQLIVDSLKAKAENVAEFTTQLAELRATSIPASPAARELLVYVEEMAAESNVDFVGAAVGAPSLYAVTAEGSMAPAPEGDLAQTLYSVPINITITGTSAQVLEFVHELQTSEANPGRLIIIPTLGFAALGGESTITIQGYAFFIDDPDVPASVTESIAPAAPAADDDAPVDEAPAPEESTEPAPTPEPTTTP